MIRVETHLFDKTERLIFGAAIDAIEDHRRTLQEQLHGNAAPGMRVPEVVETPLGSEKAAALVSVETAVVEKKTRAPRKKAEVVETITAEAPPALEGDEAPMREQRHGGALKSGGAPAPKKVETEVVVTNVAVDLDGARAKLQTFAEKQGLPAASKLLAEFGAKRIGDVPANRLEAFVARLG